MPEITLQAAKLFSEISALGLMIMVGMGIVTTWLAIRYGSLKTENVELRRQNTELAKHALKDPLCTKLANRRAFRELLDYAIAQSRRYGRSVSVLYLDVDHFKSVNDTLGHTIGDKILIDIGEVLLSECRDADTVARLSGDEFAIILPEMGTENAVLKANRIREAVRSYSDNSRALSSMSLLLGFSIGVATFPENGATMDSLLSYADNLMYVAKHQNGGNQVVSQ